MIDSGAVELFHYFSMISHVKREEGKRGVDEAAHILAEFALFSF